MLAADGRGSNPVHVDYARFRDRQVAAFQPGAVAVYSLSAMDAARGTLEFWIKLDTLPPAAPSPLVQLSGEHLFLRVSMEHENLLFESGVDPQQPQVTFRSRRPLIRGSWTLAAFRWDAAANRVSLLENGDPADLESSGAFPSIAAWKMNQLQVGLQGKEDPSLDCEIDLQDLRIWQNEVEESALRKSYRAEADAMSAPLVLRAADLFHFDGVKVPDSAASGGAAWAPDTLLAALNPIALPAAGDYTLTFRIKAATNIPGGSLSCRVFSDSGDGTKTVLADWSDQARDLRAGDEYVTLIVPFRVSSQATRVGYEFRSYIPSRYSLFLDTVTLGRDDGTWQDTRRFEDLKHTMGVWHEDPDAANGKAWTNANTLHYGPYACLGLPGKYRATWRIKIAGDAPGGVPLLLLDVFSHDGYFAQGRRGNKSYAKLALSAAEFNRRNTWEDKSVEFSYDGCDMMEFRAFAKLMQPGVVAIDTVTVERLEGR